MLTPDTKGGRPSAVQENADRRALLAASGEKSRAQWERLLEEADGVLLINPGSCRDERYYAELEVETGQILTAQLCLGSPRITRRQKPTWWQPSR